MRKIFLFLSLASMSVVCFAQSTLNDVCASKENAEKYVLKLYKDTGRTAFVCTVSSYSEHGDQNCESNLAVISGVIPGFWTAIADLNQDNHLDVIVSQWLGGPWLGSRPYYVLANCGNNTYVKIYDNPLATLKVGTFNKITGWAHLKGTIDELLEDGENYSIEDLDLEFDSKSFSYNITHATRPGKKTDNNDDLSRTEMPNDPRIHWEQFPSVPSFDCIKASTTVEKTICANAVLSRLDVALSTNYRGKASVDLGKNKNRFTADQRAWLKQRNTCKTADCLRESYILRIGQICNDYPVLSANPPKCTTAEEAIAADETKKE